MKVKRITPKVKRITPKLGMSSREFETVLQTHFPQVGPLAALAKMLHRNRRTVRRWRSDPASIPPEAILLIRAMRNYNLEIHDVETLAKSRSDT